MAAATLVVVALVEAKKDAPSSLPSDPTYRQKEALLVKDSS